jgi:uncharacterized protein with GYD domain
MARYLYIVNYSPQGAGGILKDGGSARRAAAEAAIKSVGATLVSFDFAFGADDAYIIADSPTPEGMAAVSLAVAAGGGATGRTILLLSPEQLDEAAKLTPSYQPPGA